MNPDDPKLTAYALDELDPAERAEIEQLLRKDPAARAEMEETTSFVAQLRRELKAETGLPLTDAQRDALLATAEAEPSAAAVNVVALPRSSRWRRRWLPLAAALCVVAGVATLMLDHLSFLQEKAAPTAPDFQGDGLTIRASVSAPVTIEGPKTQFGSQVATPPPTRIAAITTSASTPPVSDNSPVLFPNSNLVSPNTSSPVPLAENVELKGYTMRLSPDAAKNESHLAPPAEQPRIALSNVSVSTVSAAPLPITRTESVSGPTAIGQAATFTSGTVIKSSSGTLVVAGKDLEADRQQVTVPAFAVAAPPSLNVAMTGRTGGFRQREDISDVSKFDISGVTTRALSPAPSPSATSANTARGIEHYKAARYDEAGNDLTKALAENPADAVAHNYLGLTASQKGWQDAAQKELETAARLDSAYADARFNLAVVLATRQPPKREEARHSYQLAIQLGAERDHELERLIGQSERGNTEAYDIITDNTFQAARENPLSTFSIDVDTASYANVRRFLSQQSLPPKGAVRIEELLNYFTYDYPQPEGDKPFSATMEVAACPWEPEHRLVRIGLKGREIAKDKRPASNLVFLIDVSGSMQPENKLPLLKKSLRLLVDNLSAEDSVAIAVYAGASGMVLEPTNDKRRMREALDRLESGGSTNGAAGIQLAYRLAEQSFIKGGVNRVILATDGDFNVGVTSESELTDLITRKAKSGTFLTVLGFGMGNLKDSTLEKLADKGNGNYAYIDTLNEGRKVLVEQMSGTLVTIAKDVKIQVEFNPAQVGSYRLIGYENRLLAKEDFNNDKKDAGEIGAGHTVTALYEVVPVGAKAPGTPAVDALKYGPRPVPTTAVPALEGDPGDAFVTAYKQVQQAEQAEQRGQLDAALKAYREAGARISQIAQAFPEWQPSIVIYRQQRTNDAISRVEKRLQPSGSVASEAATRTADANPAKAEVELLALKSHPASNPQSAELLTLKLRYKQPDGDKSKLLEFPLTDRGETWEKSSRDFRFAAAVAGFGMLLRESPHKGSATWETIRELAVEGQGEDRSGYRAEFLALLDKAKALGR